jgi:hypothetical protein
MRGGLGTGDGFALGDLVGRRQLAHRVARQQARSKTQGRRLISPFALR